MQLAQEHSNHPWLMFGDFNHTCHPDDRNNANFDAATANLFNSTIDTALLQELPLADRLYTWSNRRADPTPVRLDRAFINFEWNGALFNSTLTSLPRPVSDHVLIVVSASSGVPTGMIFRYKQSLAFHNSYRELVAEAWARPSNSSGSQVSRLVRSLKWVCVESKKWAKSRHWPGEVIANFHIIIDLSDRLGEWRRLSRAELSLRSQVQDRLIAANMELAAYWKQRYTFRACKLGDENIKFFHASSSARLLRNHIVVLHDGDSVVRAHRDKERLLHTFYSELLGTPQPTTCDFDLGALMPPVASLEPVDEPFTNGEARDALWRMHSSSSPEPDGFGPGFFKTFWPLIRRVVMAFLAAFQGGTADMEAINRAFLVLVPQKEVVTAASNFRPVSLQNYAPKIASKIMTTRLQ